MEHWLETYYGHIGKGELQPIKYTPGFEKKKLEVVTQPGYAPIAEGQGIDRNTSSILADKTGLMPLKGYAGQLVQALKDAGISGPVLDFALVQLYMESAGFSNGPARKDNNPGNITWYKGVKKGVYMPANKTYAAHYDSLQQFAGAYLQLLSKGARPLDAATLEDFAHRLKLNNYYGKESEASYLQKLQGTAARLNQLAVFYKATDKKMSKDAHPSWWKKHPLLTGLILAAGAVVVIKAVK